MSILYTSCTLRLNPKTTENKVRHFLHYVFDGFLEDEIAEEILETFREFSGEGRYGRITYAISSGLIEFKEDNIRI